MKCTICSIDNRELRGEIEALLEQNSGCLSTREKQELKVKYHDAKEIAQIDAITDNDCSLHWNFHQVIHREAPGENSNEVLNENSGTKSDKNGFSLADDIDKDEAQILYEVIAAKSATFKALSNKINATIKNTPAENLQGMIINPGTVEFYLGVSKSLRDDVHELNVLNSSINGSKSSALEGLRALHDAINSSSEPADQTTKEYDY